MPPPANHPPAQLLVMGRALLSAFFTPHHLALPYLTVFPDLLSSREIVPL